ncbi:MAG: iron transporter FeoB [Calditrichaeota bacterium]|nr:MAG: iron transporter FeoB [Calditrichota bacterium]
MVQDNICNDCAAHSDVQLKKLGLDMARSDYIVALAGNPNTGKSTVFNNLTGLRQHTGNWPGKTVSRAEGSFSYADKKYKLVDLPGTYSLLSASTDEEIARNFILFGKPDVTLIIADASRLERNLNLTLQILEITDRAVLCLNLIDEAKRHGIVIDDRNLAKELGIPVVPATARFGLGMQKLLQSLKEVATGEFQCKPRKIKTTSPFLKRALNKLIPVIEEKFPGISNARWIALRMLEGDKEVMEAIENGKLGTLEI